MKRSVSTRIMLFVMICTLIITSVPVYAVSDTSTSDTTVVGTDIPFDYDRYIEIQDDLDVVMTKIKKYSREEENKDANITSKLSTNEYDTLVLEREQLLNELDSMGAVLDLETLAKFPAPSSTQTRSGLTGNLAELAEYYANWFLFSGYEYTKTYNGKSYQTCVVTVRDIAGNSGLLTSVNNEAELVSDSESASADSLNEVINTCFGLFADELSSTLDLGRIKTWVVSTTFSAFASLVKSGTIVIRDNCASYNYRVGLETNLYYGYVWDDDADEWVYCVSSGKVYGDEEHVLSYWKYVGGNGGQYDWEEERITSEYSKTTVGISQLASLAAQIYSNNGDRAPSYSESYQMDSIIVERKWNGRGNFVELGDDFIFHPVSCARPGDLWTLGTLN